MTEVSIRIIMVKGYGYMYRKQSPGYDVRFETKGEVKDDTMTLGAK